MRKVSLRGHTRIAAQVRNWFVLFGVVPVTVVLLFCLSLTRQYFQRITDEALKQSSKRLMSELFSLINGYIGMVDLLAEDQSVIEAMGHAPNRRTEATDAASRLLSTTKDRFQIHLLSVDNSFRYSTGSIPALYTMPVYKNYGIFQLARRTPHATVMKSTALTSYTKAKMAIALCRAVLNGKGTIIGFVVINIPQDTLRACMQNSRPLAGQEMVIVDETDTVAYSMADPSNEGVLLKNAGFRNAFSLLNGNADAWDVRDHSAYSVFTIDKTGFRAGISVSHELPDSISEGINTFGFYILALTITIALLAGLLLSKKIGAQFKRLISIFEHTREGEFDQRFAIIKGDYMDIALLGGYYNDLADRIQELLERIRQEQSFLSTAELKMLESQIRPHFIHNILNDIKSLSKLGRNQEINDLVIAFSRILRSCLSPSDTFITVGEEMELLQSYIQLQNIRMSHPAHMHIKVDADILHLEIPRLMLQPIVENAFVHGFGKKPNPHLYIRGYRDQGQVVIVVVDNGGEYSGEQTIPSASGITLYEGMGLQNIHKRLILYYQEEERLVLSSKPGHYTKVVIRFDEKRPSFTL